MRRDIKIPHSRMTKTYSVTLVGYCEAYVTSHKKPFASCYGGIRLPFYVYRCISWAAQWEVSYTLKFVSQNKQRDRIIFQMPRECCKPDLEEK